MLAYFNWGVYSPPEIEVKLRELVGCTEKDGNGRYVFTDEDEPGILFIPKPWRAEKLAAGKQHTVFVRQCKAPMTSAPSAVCWSRPSQESGTCAIARICEGD